MKSAKTVDYSHGFLPSQELCLSFLIKVNERNFEKFVAFKVERLTDNYVTMIVLSVCKNQLCNSESVIGVIKHICDTYGPFKQTKC